MALLSSPKPPKQWTFSLFFHFLDRSRWRWIERFRIQESQDAVSRNKTTVGQVVRAVLLQQAIQTVLGWWWLDASEANLLVNHARAMKDLRPIVSAVLQMFMVQGVAGDALDAHGSALVSVLYWWLIPIGQFLFAL